MMGRPRAPFRGVENRETLSGCDPVERVGVRKGAAFDPAVSRPTFGAGQRWAVAALAGVSGAPSQLTPP